MIIFVIANLVLELWQSHPIVITRRSDSDWRNEVTLESGIYYICISTCANL
ncbi:MAG: hypothetical protein UW64_C0003G0074 [Microgenomates group bacterium GW2011_GWC1_44_37]|uniref:Uncharacterized protein n=1 Tax=Candidatus Collierbacteria bacterium GW2011_GWB2_44_22 TaxID=1618387 RepID=A0A0G1HZD7_9BACT|nr:MAG: hypothetical protein UW44_C0001G0073 [Candidatus Collierbacteria bacterium GW2011_GWB2_44_22]KKT69224.1 MAG: hypothetical protein UW64_C0003G0074 [Microgenomates group bacterium GW2011_GWC1_44_37]KKT89504.1 MAG: hypothetical protein UW88_C0002G0035 [Candidatus Collierbacteria bacterium GW2011_GWD2_45_10]